ncbi:mobilization protein, partial [Bacteroidales bacterium OttesenSCG-928-M11]|nr:mobilization protein [Bacteroidales bacterium OttesenSCG-928-M11]
MNVRLTILMESRIHGDVYVRFGGEYLETCRLKERQGAEYLAYGQIASAKIPLSRMISPQLYWVMSGDEFTLDINNPDDPKVLVVGNNPDRQNIYGAALGLYNSRIVKLINKKGQLKSSVVIDELPTIYFKGLDNLIATARSNKVA